VLPVYVMNEEGWVDQMTWFAKLRPALPIIRVARCRYVVNYVEQTHLPQFWPRVFLTKFKVNANFNAGLGRVDDNVDVLLVFCPGLVLWGYATVPMRCPHDSVF
jgi:ubiquitin C-terminal hydrolase